MAKSSPYFLRIRRDVVKIISSVPSGKVITFSDIGNYLDVVPRHVAYILAAIARDQTAQEIPWHRATSQTGRLTRQPLHERQAVLLKAEGLRFGSNGGVIDFAEVIVQVVDLKHGLSPQKRPLLV